MDYEVIIDALEEKIRRLSFDLDTQEADTAALDWVIGVIHDYRNAEVIQGHMVDALTRGFLNRDGMSAETHHALMSAFSRKSKELAKKMEQAAPAPF